MGKLSVEISTKKEIEMNVNFAKEIVKELKNEILESDFWICQYEGGEAVDVEADYIVASTKRLIGDKDLISTSTGNYKIMYEEGTEDDKVDKVYIFKDYIELSIPKRICK